MCIRGLVENLARGRPQWTVLSYYGAAMTALTDVPCRVVSRSAPAVVIMVMPQPPLDPPVADQAPQAEVLTGYDQEHLVTYLRLLDADTEGADWTEVARIVLHIDPSREPERARRAWESHLARAGSNMPTTPDWRNAAAYTYLQELSRAELAWEFLRRNPTYNRDFRATARRTLDGHLAGETYRDIARVLFGATRIPAGPAWKTHDLRDRTIRLVRTGLHLMRGGYLDLLRYPLRRGGS
jgi:hypothetical protein